MCLLEELDETNELEDGEIQSINHCENPRIPQSPYESIVKNYSYFRKISSSLTL